MDLHQAATRCAHRRYLRGVCWRGLVWRVVLAVSAKKEGIGEASVCAIESVARVNCCRMAAPGGLSSWQRLVHDGTGLL